jgi:hypothetical protein
VRRSRVWISLANTRRGLHHRIAHLAAPADLPVELRSSSMVPPCLPQAQTCSNLTLIRRPAGTEKTIVIVIVHLHFIVAHDPEFRPCYRKFPNGLLLQFACLLGAHRADDRLLAPESRYFRLRGPVGSFFDLAGPRFLFARSIQRRAVALAQWPLDLLVTIVCAATGADLPSVRTGLSWNEPWAAQYPSHSSRTLVWQNPLKPYRRTDIISEASPGVFSGDSQI